MWRKTNMCQNCMYMEPLLTNTTRTLRDQINWLWDQKIPAALEIYRDPLSIMSQIDNAAVAMHFLTANCWVALIWTAEGKRSMADWRLWGVELLRPTKKTWAGLHEAGMRWNSILTGTKRMIEWASEWQGSKTLEFYIVMGQTAHKFCLPWASLICKSLCFLSCWQMTCLGPLPIGQVKWKVTCPVEKSTCPGWLEDTFFKPWVTL